MFSRLWMFVGLSLWVWCSKSETTLGSEKAPETSTVTGLESSSENGSTTSGKAVEKKSIEIGENAPNEVPSDSVVKDSERELPVRDLRKELHPENNASCIVSNQTQFSWLVKILDKRTKKQVCTGTLITDEDILVPASCFLDHTTEKLTEAFYELGAKLFAVAGGGVNHNCMQVRNVSVIYPHKGYFESTEEYDYAFLKVTPEFDVDDEDIPDLRYHLNVINSEGGMVNIHNNGPFCESPYFVDDGFNTVVAEERHLLGMRIDDCMLKWNCSADYDTCLSYLHPAHYACLKPLTPRKCGKRDRGAPLVCDEVFLGYLHMCDGEQPMIFRGLNKAIKFLELEDDHIQEPGYLGKRY